LAHLQGLTKVTCPIISSRRLSREASAVEPGFHIVQRAMQRGELEKTLFESPGAIILERFRSLNPHLTQYARPGHIGGHSGLYCYRCRNPWRWRVNLRRGGCGRRSRI